MFIFYTLVSGALQAMINFGSTIYRFLSSPPHFLVVGGTRNWPQDFVLELHPSQRCGYFMVTLPHCPQPEISKNRQHGTLKGGKGKNL
jgi:hypothetical protein